MRLRETSALAAMILVPIACAAPPQPPVLATSPSLPDEAPAEVRVVRELEKGFWHVLGPAGDPVLSVDGTRCGSREDGGRRCVHGLTGEVLENGAGKGHRALPDEPIAISVRPAPRHGWQLERTDPPAQRSRRIWRWELPEVIHASADEVIVSALDCIGGGSRSGRLLVFDRDLTLQSVATVPPHHYRVVARRGAELHVLVQGYELACPTHAPSSEADDLPSSWGAGLEGLPPSTSEWGERPRPIELIPEVPSWQPRFTRQREVPAYLGVVMLPAPGGH